MNASDRIERLEDREAIYDLLKRYCYLIAAADVDVNHAAGSIDKIKEGIVALIDETQYICRTTELTELTE